MEQIYNWIGLSIFWLCAIIGSTIIFFYLLKEFIDYLGKRFKILWVILEFARYRKDFKEWLNDKKANKKIK